MYVDSLDISGLNIDLPDGQFLVNIWSKNNIDIVLDSDMKRDLSGFGNLEASYCLLLFIFFFPVFFSGNVFYESSPLYNPLFSTLLCVSCIHLFYCSVFFTAEASICYRS